MGRCEEPRPQVNKDWDTFKVCPHASRMWVYPQNIHQPKLEYENGTFPRVWCQHDGGWCQVTTELDDCSIDHDE